MTIKALLFTVHFTQFLKMLSDIHGFETSALKYSFYAEDERWRLLTELDRNALVRGPSKASGLASAFKNTSVQRFQAGRLLTEVDCYAFRLRIPSTTLVLTFTPRGTAFVDGSRSLRSRSGITFTTPELTFTLNINIK